MRRVFLAFILIVFVDSVASAQTLRIYHIDVEQADSALIVMPNGKSLLIDAGKNKHGKRIKKVMDAAGVTQIDAFVNSHFHEDHFGGADDLHNMGVEILEVYDRGQELASAADKAQKTFREYRESVGEDAIRLKPGDRIELDPLVDIKCISASGFVINDPNPGAASHDENDLSVSLLLTFRGFKAFFGGDTENPTEERIEAADLVTDVDLYKSNHHGSNTSSSHSFLGDLRPSLVVISNGSNKGYNHPQQTTLQAYRNLPMPPVVLQTNRCKHPAPCGNVDNASIADVQSSGEIGTILVTVDGATASYTARYGTTVRNFQIKAPVDGGAATTSTTVIQSLLPNPDGDDEQLEEVTLKNAGTLAINLTGWMLKDRSGLTWMLTGAIAPGQSQAFRRGGQAMSLNNNGDEITLIDAASVARDRFSYATSSEGQQIVTSH
jgi:beta-lactamase superfamily II metal-dependent hydrolase